MTPCERQDAERIVAAARGRAGALIPTLLALQERLGHLPESALELVGASLGVGAAELAGVLSFYPRFRTRPGGRVLIQVCMGTACHLRGSADTYAELRHQLGLAEGEDTDAQRRFTLEPASCLGCCMLAPAVRIGSRTYGHVDAARVPGILADFLATEHDPPPTPGSVSARTGVVEAAGELRLCRCTSCASAGAAQLDRALRQQVASTRASVRVRSVGCTGLSSEAPVVDVVVHGEPVARYGRVDSGLAPALMQRHFEAALGPRARATAARWLDRLLTGAPPDPLGAHRLALEGGGGPAQRAGATRLSTAWAGELDPLDLDAYVGRGGFEASRRALEELEPLEIIDAIATAGLRGRGGAGFATAEKWAETRAAQGRPKIVICNGDEGDAGAFMDRMLLESFPFRVIEGMVIAAAAVGATEGWVYVRGEYRQAIGRVRRAIERCRERGLLQVGGQPFELAVFEGAGAFVCGEETALIEAMEGRRGVPRVRPPFPSERGLRGLPTLVNNVETLALVPGILAEGPEGFASLGTPASRGTKTFALAGRVRRGGLIEAPMGMSLRRIVEEAGGGLEPGHALTAIQVGGPAGGCVPAAEADAPVDYEALQDLGAIMGSGGLIVLDERDCVVDLARYFAAFARQESCGACSVCRIGTVRLHELLEGLCEGRGEPGQLALLEELGQQLATASRCGLGRSAPRTALSILRHFPEQVQAHLGGRCPAGRCKGLIRYGISDRCIGCTRCAQRCPADAISARPHQRHEIDERACTRCDLCRQTCPVGAVEVT